MTETLEFVSKRFKLRGRFHFPNGVPTRKMPVVIMATGDGMDGSKSSTWSLLAERLASAGLPSFVFDFQGLGYSDGPAAELNLTIGLENLKSAVAAVRKVRWVDVRRIGLLGSSFGGNVALLFAGQYGSIKALGFKSTASFYPEVHETFMGVEGVKEWKRLGFNKEYGFNYSFYLDGFNHNTYAVAKNIKVPVLLIHGDADKEVPLIQDLRLAECLGGETRLEILPGVGHGYKEGDSKERMATMLAMWFKEKL